MLIIMHVLVLFTFVIFYYNMVKQNCYTVCWNNLFCVWVCVVVGCVPKVGLFIDNTNMISTNDAWSWWVTIRTRVIAVCVKYMPWSVLPMGKSQHLWSSFYQKGLLTNKRYTINSGALKKHDLLFYIEISMPVSFSYKWQRVSFSFFLSWPL